VSWSLRYAASAVRSLRKLDPQIQRRLKIALEELAENPERGKALQMTLQGLRSWRAGDYRIVYRVLSDRIEVLVLAIGHRRDVYERVRRLLD
jgi:mRNA interferase RelE/StbE